MGKFFQVLLNGKFLLNYDIDVEFKEDTIYHDLAVVPKGISSVIKSSGVRDCKILKSTKEEVQEMIKKYSFVSLGKRFGVSDNAVRKWCHHYKIEIPRVVARKFKFTCYCCKSEFEMLERDLRSRIRKK